VRHARNIPSWFGPVIALATSRRTQWRAGAKRRRPFRPDSGCVGRGCAVGWERRNQFECRISTWRGREYRLARSVSDRRNGSLGEAHLRVAHETLRTARCCLR
jgi:hypothetical protein